LGLENNIEIQVSNQRFEGRIEGKNRLNVKVAVLLCAISHAT
jgi:hypothetical protein